MTMVPTSFDDHGPCFIWRPWSLLHLMTMVPASFDDNGHCFIWWPWSLLHLMTMVPTSFDDNGPYFIWWPWSLLHLMTMVPASFDDHGPYFIWWPWSLLHLMTMVPTSFDDHGPCLGNCANLILLLNFLQVIFSISSVDKGICFIWWPWSLLLLLAIDPLLLGTVVPTLFILWPRLTYPLL